MGDCRVKNHMLKFFVIIVTACLYSVLVGRSIFSGNRPSFGGFQNENTVILNSSVTSKKLNELYKSNSCLLENRLSVLFKVN